MLAALWFALGLPCTAIAGPPLVAVEAVAVHAPRPFTPEQIRDAMPAGTRISLRIETDAQEPIAERWTVIEATPDGCTIASVTYAPTSGALIEDESTQTSAWAELAEHATFPAADTSITESSFDGPLGRHATREYRVRHADGELWIYRFALELPGPPVELVVEREGKVTFRMTQVLRQRG